MARSQSRQGQPSLRRGLAVASLDIGRVLADRDGVTFRALGTCMYPTVRPGDVLRIRSCPAADVVVGDIAVCRTPDYLFSHRVIETGSRGGRAYIITRPDRSDHGSDGPTFDDDLLGVVTGIERDGLPVSLKPVPGTWAGRSYLSARLALIEAGPRTRLGLMSALARAQDLRPYRFVARRGFSSRRSRVRFTVRVPLNATLGDAVFREIESSDPDALVPWKGRSVDHWTLVARLSGAQTPAGTVGAMRGPDGTWQVDEPHVRLRYRGTGLDGMLLAEAKAVLDRSARPRE